MEGGIKTQFFTVLTRTTKTRQAPAFSLIKGLSISRKDAAANWTCLA
jgi:hypothetical protein